jgi:hypothetical protein
VVRLPAAVMVPRAARVGTRERVSESE